MTSSSPALAYAPDHASPPGDLLQEYLDHLGISSRELARRCGRSGKLIAEIVSAKATLEPETALQLERVLDVPAAIWSNMEAAYQLHQAREAEHLSLSASHDWAKSFPLKELAERGYIRQVKEKADQVWELLRFFGVGSPKACDDKVAELLAADFRTSPAFANDVASLAAWLRVGERRAEKIVTADYNKEAFLAALSDIRSLTVVPINEALPQLVQKCAAAGVVFILEQPFARVRASGVSRWLAPRKALIQQSLRHKTDDHFWFTFFHECAHLLLHSRKEIFIDMMKGGGSAGPKEEGEANIWSSDILIPSGEMLSFMRKFVGTAAEVVAFAKAQGIAPGIVVGQLQYNKAVSFAALNDLKVRYAWSE